MQIISPCLWFDSQAEDAARFYTSIFKNSRIKSISRYGDEGFGEKGKVMTVIFDLEGEEFMALNGGPVYTFSPATSFFVNCANQAEIDHLWSKLTDGGQEMQCGWLTDKFGVTWQIVPTALGAMMKDPDPEKVNRVTHAMLQMVKLDLGALQSAYEGKG